MVGRCISHWNNPFLGDMLVFQGVCFSSFDLRRAQLHCFWTVSWTWFGLFGCAICAVKSSEIKNITMFFWLMMLACVKLVKLFTSYNVGGSFAQILHVTHSFLRKWSRVICVYDVVVQTEPTSNNHVSLHQRVTQTCMHAYTVYISKYVHVFFTDTRNDADPTIIKYLQ